MLCSEKGVLSSSRIYFYTASRAARGLFLTVCCTGRFDCDRTYLVERNRYDSALLLHVLSGGGYVMLKGQKQQLRKGDFLLLNCYEPHLYGTDEGWSILWAHFEGPTARALFSALPAQQQILHASPDGVRLHRKLETIYAFFHANKPPVDALIHNLLTDLVTAFFLTHDGMGTQESPAQCMDRVAAYLSEHLDENVPLRALAQIAHMSPSNLIRVFRREKGVSPHQYLINLRVNAAKYYLSSTELSLSRIAECCGFTDASSLVHTFQRLMNVSPRAYALAQRNARDGAS